jgi:hypothetical protein
MRHHKLEDGCIVPSPAEREDEREGEGGRAQSIGRIGLTLAFSR